MPIEIRELVIRAQVDPSDGCSSERSSNHQRDSSGSATSPIANPASGSDRADLIRTCVQEVLRILEDKRER